jgi:23S rRNA pseudouridine1911/1915/1917 synthase
MVEPQIIYEDKNFLAINKPAGLMAHGTKHTKQSHERTVVDWLVEHYPQVKTVGDDPAMRPGIVHRLDKATSGIMLIAKTQEHFEYLKSLFQKHGIKKTYYAVVRGVPKKREGIIDAPIGIINGTLKRSVGATKMRKEAVTEYKTLKAWGTESLLEVQPRTGRTHQIRVHLASIGHPIVGDTLYGPRRKHGQSTQSAAADRLMLHAAAVEFTDKDGTKLYLSTDPPFAIR